MWSTVVWLLLLPLASLCQCSKSRGYEAARREYQENVNAYYDRYFAQLDAYAEQVQKMRYRQLLEQQARQRAQFEDVFKNVAPSRRPPAVQNTDISQETTPRSPFGASPRPLVPFPEGIDHASRRSFESLARPSLVPPRADNAAAYRSAAALESLCQRFLSTVRRHCSPRGFERGFEKKCRAYFEDCQRFIVRSDPLYSIAHSFSSGVGLNLGSWGVSGIPYYPINEEGAIGAGNVLNVPFGGWGGGYSQNIGVRDYWSQYQEAGANWYDGKYGYRSGWSMPLVQSLGVEGESHAVASVPLKPGELGKPIGVDVGGSVGPYYSQNNHVGVDYLNGQVSQNFGVGVPMAGVGVSTGVGVSFPSIADFMG